MKKINEVFNNKKTSLLILLFSVFITGFYSCRKDLTKQVEDENRGNPSLQMADVNVNQLKSLYLQESKSTPNVKTTGLEETSARFLRNTNINWDSYVLLNRDSSRVIEFNISGDTSLVIMKNQELGADKYGMFKTHAVFLEFANGKRLNFFMQLIEDISTPGHSSVIDQTGYNRIPKEFNGLVLYFTFDKQYIGGYRFDGGKPTKTVEMSNQPASSQVLNSDYKTLTQRVCTTTEIYDNYCNYTLDESTGEKRDEHCYSVYRGSVTECVDFDLPPGSGGFPGDPGYNPNPDCPPVGVSSIKGGKKVLGIRYPCNPGSTPTPPAPPVDDDATDDPCAKKNILKARQEDPKVAEKIKQLRNKLSTPPDVEWGVEQRLTSWPNGTYKDVAISPGVSINQWNYHFTWNSTSGFTISTAHIHPNYTAPSYVDVFGMVNNLKGPALRNAGAAAQAYYRNNAYITVINDDRSFIAEINNWDAVSALNDEYKANEVAFKTKWEALNIAFSGDTPAALMSLFKEAINLYKADGSSTNYQPMKLDANSKSLVPIPCP